MTRTEFQAIESNMKELHLLLSNPILQTALQIVRDEGKPMNLIGAPGQEYIAYMAVENGRHYGWHQALNRLISLTVKPKKMAPPIPQEEEFSHASKDILEQRGITET